ncbi:hypothetical protein HRG_012595 [Hirsutella rhossiliensis]
MSHPRKPRPSLGKNARRKNATQNLLSHSAYSHNSVCEAIVRVIGIEPGISPLGGQHIAYQSIGKLGCLKLHGLIGLSLAQRLMGLSDTEPIIPSIQKSFIMGRACSQALNREVDAGQALPPSESGVESHLTVPYLLLFVELQSFAFDNLDAIILDMAWRAGSGKARIAKASFFFHDLCVPQEHPPPKSIISGGWHGRQPLPQLNVFAAVGTLFGDASFGPWPFSRRPLRDPAAPTFPCCLKMPRSPWQPSHFVCVAKQDKTALHLNMLETDDEPIYLGKNIGSKVATIRFLAEPMILSTEQTRLQEP